MNTIIVDRSMGFLGTSNNVIAPLLINSYSVLSVPAYWRAMNFLANNLASFPRCVRMGETDAAPEDESHPLDDLLDLTPNGYQNGFIFWRTLYFQAAHVGNAFAEIQRDDATMQPIALHNLSWENVAPFRYDMLDGRGPRQYYAVRGGPDQPRILPGADVIHLQGLGWDGMSGMNPIWLHDDTFQRATTHTRYMTKYLQKGTMIRGAVEIPEGATNEQIQDILNLIRTFFSGADAERDLLVLQGGAKLSNATITPQDSQLNEQGAEITKSIAQLTGVPPAFLYEMSEMKYNENAVEAMGQDVVRYTFRPWIDQIEAELTLKLLSEDDLKADYQVHLDPSALLKGDTATIAQIANEAKTGGLITPNEGRAMLGYPPDKAPSSDSLQTLGSAEPPKLPTDKKQLPPPQNSDPMYSAIRPVLDAACARVDAKTDKAFENNAGKKDQERTIWANVFAEEQVRYVTESLAPVSESLRALKCQPLDVQAIAQKYCAAIRKRAATGETVKLLDLAEKK